MDPRAATIGARHAFASAIALRIALGLALIASLVPLSVDDYFRVYHAIHFWQRPSFSPSTNWLPLFTWVHGSLVGLVGETRMLPRVASLVLGLAGCWLATLDTRDTAERRARWLLAACLPSSVLLFALPLSEAMFGALVTAHVAFLARYRAEGRIVDAWVASMTLLGASATRYEAWALLPLGAALIAQRAPSDSRRSIAVALGLVPLSFPLRWLVHLDDRTGDAFSFLGVIARDQFGPGSLSATLFGASAPIAAVFALACLASVVGLSARAPAAHRLASFYGLGFVAFFVLVAARNSLPSQLPFRLFHVPTLLAVPTAVRVLGLAERPGRALGLGALGIALGLLVAARLPGVVASDDVRLGTELRRRLARAPEASAIVQGPFPEVSYFVVAASAVGRVQVDGAGRRCRVSVERCVFECGRPAFLDRLRFAVVASPTMQTELASSGFVVRARSRRYALLERVDVRAPICPGSRPR